MTTGCTATLNQETLDRVGRAADRAVRAVLETHGALLEGDPVNALAHVADANEATQSAYMTLVQAGARVEETPGPLPVALELLSTPAVDRLLDALQYAVRCAEEVDRERGWTLADGTGIGLTDTVGDVYERLRQSAQGPKGRE